MNGQEYQVLMQISKSIGSLEGKFEGMSNDIKGINVHLGELNLSVAKNGNRISALEKAKTWGVGFAAGVSFVVTAAVNAFALFGKKFFK